MPAYSIVGKRIPNVDSKSKSGGQAQYVDDLRFPNMLHSKLLGSPFSHARILDIDVSRAKALPGVKAVITGKDIPDVIFGSIFKHADHNALAVNKVRHVGDAVAAVAAIAEEIAQ
ncbi:MAG: 4-hydroxybenzoyl-CoA reductase subunit alpha, partial [Candidatus Woesebacteria bacterium]|nr:4-hydroxybenzoyl-CoA reductase subunit alpha [Candidatus Woesebacteria bacterium]